MYDIKQVSEIVNISKTSIYNTIKRMNIKTVKKEGKTNINESSLKIIILYYSKERLQSLTNINENENIYQDDFKPDFEPNFQSVKKDDKVENLELINFIEDKTNEINNNIQANFQSMFQLENDKKDNEIKFLKQQINEKDKIIESLIQTLNHDKQYHTALLIDKNKNSFSTSNEDSNFSNNKKSFFKFWRK